jgi:hypothetical protein
MQAHRQRQVEQPEKKGADSEKNKKGDGFEWRLLNR